MKPESVIEIVVAIAMVVIIGFLVIGMMEGFLNEGGIVYNFIQSVLDKICAKAESLINGYTYTNSYTPSV